MEPKEKKNLWMPVGFITALVLLFAETTFLLVSSLVSKNSNNKIPDTGTETEPGGGLIAKSYTITWMNDDGTILEVDQNVEEGVVPTYDSATPVKDNNGLISYTFANWNKTVVAASADTTYVATYTATYNDAKVVFDLNGHGENVNTTVTYGGLVSKPADPSAEGYDFVGWYKEPSGKYAWNFSTDKVYEDTTIYAVWEIKYFTVTFDMQGVGDQVPSQSVAYGGKVVDPGEITGYDSDRYRFDGWQYMDENYDYHMWDFDTNVVTGDVTLMACWIITI